MSDGTSPAGAHLDRLERHLLEKGAAGPCPICGTIHWGVVVDDDGAVARKVTPTGPPAYALACGNCGFLRWHVVSLLDKGGAERPPPP